MATALLESLDLEAIVITLDRHGALLLERGGEAQLIPTRQRKVYDVTGAGDMVLAAVTAARVHDVTWHDAVVVSNAAAGLEVEEFGAAPDSTCSRRSRSTSGCLAARGQDSQPPRSPP